MAEFTKAFLEWKKQDILMPGDDAKEALQKAHDKLRNVCKEKRKLIKEEIHARLTGEKGDK